MGSTDPKLSRTGALVGRYLDPTSSWTGAQDRELRDLCRDSEACGTAYDRAVTIHRLLVGADPDLPSGFEQQRMMAVLIEPSPMPRTIEPNPLPRSILGWLRPALLGAAALLVVGAVLTSGQVRRAIFPEERAGDYDFVARGADGFELTVGIGISGVTKGGQEYEAVAVDLAERSGLFLEEYLRISTTREVDELGHAFVFGMQPSSREPIWYSPNPEEGEHESRPVEMGRAVPLGGSENPFEFQLSVRHGTGALRVVAIFTAQPLSVTAVRSAIDAWPEHVPLEDWLRGMLGLASDGVIRILEVEIAPGKMRSPGGIRAESPIRGGIE